MLRALSKICSRVNLASCTPLRLLAEVRLSIVEILLIFNVGTSVPVSTTDSFGLFVSVINIFTQV